MKIKKEKKNIKKETSTLICISCKHPIKQKGICPYCGVRNI